MKDRGEYHLYGRKPKITYIKFYEAYKKVLAGELKPFACINELGISKTVYYRYKKKYEITTAFDTESD